MISLGAIVLTCAPAAIAISGSSLSGSAAQAQYPPPDPTTTPGPRPTPLGAEAARALPFSGGPIVPVLVAALVLLGLGAVLRRSSQDRRDT